RRSSMSFILGGGSRRLAEERFLDEEEERVVARELDLLDPRGVLRGREEDEVRERRELPAVAAAEEDDPHPRRARGLEGADHVRRGAGGADPDEDVVLRAERLDLAREDLLVAEVVAARREQRGVRRERDRRQRAPRGRLAEADDQLRRDVLRVRRAAAVAADEDLAAGAEGVGDRRRDLDERDHARVGVRGAALRERALVEVGPDGSHGRVAHFGCSVVLVLVLVAVAPLARYSRSISSTRSFFRVTTMASPPRS